MEKKMEKIIVRTTKERQIEISQDYGTGEDENSSVFFTPEQVDTIVDWLQEAKKELQK